MKMTTKGRYAVTAMLDLALQYGERPTSLANIAERQDLSLSYLEQLFSQLRQGGLVNSTRGPGGGYTLSRAPDEIAVSSIIKAVNEQLPKTDGEHEPCYMSQVWNELSIEIERFLDSVSLADVLESVEVRNVAERQQRIFVENHLPSI
ncbi:MAG: Rrf2 family transcriptional regulator [Gammaproteobacteria bacterium]|nr:Rrf2 family transcriptional regulator [Gammaproteobacteria bacterium]